MSGIMRNSQGHFSYNAAKGATVHLTKLMSAEFEKARVRVNSIAPGYFPSEMTAKSSGDDQKSELPAEKVAEKGHVPAQRAGHDEEMAQAVVRIQYSFFECPMTTQLVPYMVPMRLGVLKPFSLQIFLAKNMYVNGEILAVDGGALLKLPGR